MDDLRAAWQGFLVDQLEIGDDDAEAFGTLTYRDVEYEGTKWGRPPGLQARDRAVAELARRIPGRSVAVEERGAFNGREHHHLLACVGRSYVKWLPDVAHWWSLKFGFSRIEEARGAEEVIGYVTKYVTKEMDRVYINGRRL